MHVDRLLAPPAKSPPRRPAMRGSGSDGTRTRDCHPVDRDTAIAWSRVRSRAGLRRKPATAEPRRLRGFAHRIEGCCCSRRCPAHPIRDGPPKGRRSRWRGVGLKGGSQARAGADPELWVDPVEVGTDRTVEGEGRLSDLLVGGAFGGHLAICSSCGKGCRGDKDVVRCSTLPRAYRPDNRSSKLGGLRSIYLQMSSFWDLCLE
jgi:hypothetical protein